MEETRKNYFDLMVTGLGGQGALIIGKLLAEAGMSKFKHISYFSNFGGAMRGGESECTVILSDEEIDSVIKLDSSAIIIMGPASLNEYEKRVKQDGLLVLDSSLISEDDISRKDLKALFIPATNIATELGDSRVSNFVLLGAYLNATEAVSLQLVEDLLEKKLKGDKWEALLSLDKKALQAGAEMTQ
ncbi:MAG: 2-oxoacid:acceptor oxidoreductase family protein [Thermodesulfobacteriota bacterium]|nr:2-oxoacid:acceptor oxidoreductase family protein [Thermodesulfobacteriota bacterium]